MEFMDTVKKTGKAVENAFLLAPLTDGTTDILDKLKLEHEEVADLLQQLVASESAPARKSLLKKNQGRVYSACARRRESRLRRHHRQKGQRLQDRRRRRLSGTRAGR